MAPRLRAFAASSSRLFAGALVRSEPKSLRDAASISSTARKNAGSFVIEGLVKPLTLRTNCSEAARISASVTGGSKLNKVFMLLHMGQIIGAQCFDCQAGRPANTVNGNAARQFCIMGSYRV